MQQRNLSDRIIKLDRNIRFVGIVNGRGEVIEGGFQHGVEPLLDGADEQQMYMQSLWNMTALQKYSGRLGKVRYSITEHDKVALMTFPLDDGILCLSTSAKADTNKIRDKVIKTLKEKPNLKKKKSVK
jgi:uncharacterized protein DUF6659